jgi:CBS domain-containing protein
VDTVRQWMSCPAIVPPMTMVLPEARQILRQHRIRRIPVIDADGRLIGIVTEGDINRVSESHVTDVRDYNLYHRVGDLPIGEIMTRDPITATPGMPIIEVAQRLLDHRIGGVPVVEDERVVGIITESDLFRLIVTSYQIEQSTGS